MILRSIYPAQYCHCQWCYWIAPENLKGLSLLAPPSFLQAHTPYRLLLLVELGIHLEWSLNHWLVLMALPRT